MALASRYLEYAPCILFLWIKSVVLTARFGWKNCLSGVITRLSSISAPLLLIVAHIDSLVVSSTLTALDKIDSRLILPIFLLGTATIVFSLREMMKALSMHFPAKHLRTAAASILILWRIHLAAPSARLVGGVIKSGNGYRSES